MKLKRCANYEAYFGPGTKLTVLEAGRTAKEPSVKVFPPSPKECGGQKEIEKEKRTIVCVASEFYPDHVKIYWTINGDNVTSGVSNDSAALRVDEYYKFSSRLRVTADEWYNPKKTFTCVVSFYNGTRWNEKTGSVTGKDIAIGGLPSRDKYLKVTRTARLSYTVFIIKSCFYGAFVTLLLLKLQSSAGKQKN